jgi:flavorubredoxin
MLKLVENKIKEIISMGVPVNMICPAHGIIWRDNPLQIVTQYMNWASDYQENQITILYDSMWGATRRMAEAIADGIKSQRDDINVKLYNVARSDKNDVITEVFKSKAILVGSSTINRTYLHSIAGILELIKGLSFKNKKAAAFGSYGWGGESVKLISEKLRDSGFNVVDDGIKAQWNPDEDSIDKCIAFGKNFATKIE